MNLRLPPVGIEAVGRAIAPGINARGDPASLVVERARQVAQGVLDLRLAIQGIEAVRRAIAARVYGCGAVAVLVVQGRRQVAQVVACEPRIATRRLAPTAKPGCP